MVEAHPADLSAGYRGARALVLGASGFIGRWVARRLTSLRASLAVAVRDPDAFAVLARQWEIDGDVHVVDALDHTSVESVIQRAAPDVVFNLAGFGVDRSETDPALMWRINHELVRHAALATARIPGAASWSSRTRFVHAGSALEYGLIDGLATEGGATEPHTEYGRSKLAGTMALKELAEHTGLSALTARAFTVFGPGEHPTRLLPTIWQAARTGTEVRLTAGSQARDFSYVEDVAEGLLRLGLSSGAPGEAVNLASGRMTTVRVFAAMAARVAGIPDAQLQFGQEQVRPDEMRISGADVRRFRTRTGWSMPVDLEQALGKAAAFEARLAGSL